MLNLDKIRARLDRDAVCHCGELIRHHSQLSGHTAVEMTDPSHEETHALLDEIERLRSEFAAAQAGPVVEWRGDVGTVGVFNAIVSAVGWVLFVPLADGSRTVIGIGPETGPAGKSAAEAAYRRACGFPTAPPCAG